MEMGLIFWILMLFWLCFGILDRIMTGNPQWPAWASPAGIVLQFILFLLLGWKVFGAAVK